ATLMAVSAEAAGAHCANGGSRIDAGQDANRDGMLGANEASSTQYVCNGASGAAGAAGANGAAGSDAPSALVQMLDEPSGAHCAAGGKAIRVGIDANANGVLDTAEIASTGYVCNGRDGADGSNGADGTNGTNGSDGTNGVNGLNALLVIVGESAGAHCTYGGSKVSSGLDSNASGVLDASEVTATSYLCNGAPGIMLSWITVTDPAVQAQPNTGYIAANDAQPVTVTLPAGPAVGDIVRVTGAGVGGWTIAQNAGQAVYTANLGGAPGATTTVGTGGSIVGTQFATITLQYLGNSRFNVLNHEGTLTAQ
ncbi:MAG TPA: hypothetical protein VJO99_06805, partial [Burkholderiaceae bacterium]|nr:hypothetical protein [Burkholderiaceae bacterium]